MMHPLGLQVRTKLADVRPIWCCLLLGVLPASNDARLCIDPAYTQSRDVTAGLWATVMGKQLNAATCRSNEQRVCWQYKMTT